MSGRRKRENQPRKESAASSGLRDQKKDRSVGLRGQQIAHAVCVRPAQSVSAGGMCLSSLADMYDPCSLIWSNCDDLHVTLLRSSLLTFPCGLRSLKRLMGLLRPLSSLSLLTINNGKGNRQWCRGQCVTQEAPSVVQYLVSHPCCRCDFSPSGIAVHKLPRELPVL